jgi:hypothetical protein
MSEPDNFLARWSRRKHEADRAADASRGASPRGLPQEQCLKSPADQTAGQPQADEPQPPAADPPQLPPIELINAETDIRAFLQKGIPPDLARAALRRAWSTDPGIRDFIEVAENQWDFANGNVPGFGALQRDATPRHLVQIINEAVEAAAPQPSRAADNSATLKSPVKSERARESAIEEPSAEKRDTAFPTSMPDGVNASADVSIASPDQNIAATQKGLMQSRDRIPPAKRRHGGALPN